MDVGDPVDVDVSVVVIGEAVVVGESVDDICDGVVLVSA